MASHTCHGPESVRGLSSDKSYSVATRYGYKQGGVLTVGGREERLAVLVHEGLVVDGLQQEVGAPHQAVHLILLLQQHPQLLLNRHKALSVSSEPSCCGHLQKHVMQQDIDHVWQLGTCAPS